MTNAADHGSLRWQLPPVHRSAVLPLIVELYRHAAYRSRRRMRSLLPVNLSCQVGKQPISAACRRIAARAAAACVGKGRKGHAAKRRATECQRAEANAIRKEESLMSAYQAVVTRVRLLRPISLREIMLRA